MKAIFGWFRAPGRAAALTILAIATAVYLADPYLLRELRSRGFDAMQRLWPQTIGQAPVPIVDIDEESLRKLGQWPWSRTLVAQLVERIADCKPLALGIDIIFPEPDRLSPPQIAKSVPDLPSAVSAALSSLPTSEEKLAAAIAKAPTVLGFFPSNDAPRPAPSVQRRQPLIVQRGEPAGPFLLAYKSTVRSLPEIARGALSEASLGAEVDEDGIIRAIPLVSLSEGRLLPGLAVELLRVAAGAKTVAVTADRNGVETVSVGGVSMPTDGHARAYLHFEGPIPRFISASNLFAADFDRGALEGRIVLLGVTALGAVDQKHTPLGLVQGTELHAQLIESALAGSLLSRSRDVRWLELTLLVVSGLLVVGMPGYRRPAIATAGMIGVVLALIGAEATLFRFASWLVDTLYPTAVSLTGFGTMLGGNLRAARQEQRRLATELEKEREEAERIRSAFRHYLAPDLVDLLAAHPERLRLGGETRELTLLFCDIRGFTTISESYKANPQGLTQLINRFLTPMTDLIMLRRGTIDKYMGDCIMAFWNAPLDDPDHANRACDSALEMVRQLDALNAEFATEAEAESRRFHRLDIGIGLNTGDCVVGNMGSDQRFDYSALGDAVNLASRLEGQSKTYHVSVVLGEATRTAAPSWATLELDLIEVQGKQEAVRIYALLGDQALAAAAEFQALAADHETMLACYRSRDWDGARAALGGLRGRDPRLEGLYDLYAGRITHFEDYPPPPDWNGVYVALTK